MTEPERENASFLISDEKIADSFNEIKKRLEAHSDSAIIAWSTPTLQEITPNVERSLSKKYKACQENGFKAAKVAGLYAIWVAKLKPIFSPFTKSKGLNEYAGLMVGLGYIRERLKISVKLEENELVELCDSLRYHTSSPHAMMHLFTLLIERQNLRQALSEAEEKLKRRSILQ